jgi:hypothetical protein
VSAIIAFGVGFTSALLATIVLDAVLSIWWHPMWATLLLERLRAWSRLWRWRRS